MRGSARYQCQLVWFRDSRTRAQHVKVLPFDAIEDFFPTAREKLDVDRQFTIDHANQSSSSLKPLPRTLHFKIHQLTKRRRKAAISNVGLLHAKANEIL